MIFRILAISVASAAMTSIVLGEPGNGPETIAQQKLIMEMEGAEKDSVLVEVTYRDAARLDAYEFVRAMALEEAKAGGTPDDVALLEEITAGPSLSFDGFDMTGEWQCRTIKAGGLTPLVVYDWFRCGVRDEGEGWVLEKQSGSQRTRGRFFTESDTRLIYLGSYFVAGDTPPAYGSGPDTDQAGYAFRSEEERWRIEFPAPARESKLDILEFRRPR